MKSQRIIGKYEGQHAGPLVLAFGGIHGNEVAGVKGLASLFKMLDNEPKVNPNFQFRGNLIGLAGNLQALQSNKRFISQDLNRIWTAKLLAQIQGVPLSQLQDEQRDMAEILRICRKAIQLYKPVHLVVIDLHTTSSPRGLFAIPTNNPASYFLAEHLGLPVVDGIDKGLQGTLMNFMDGTNFGIPTTAVSCESGQHQDPLSVNRSIACMVNALRAVGAVVSTDIQSYRQDFLKSEVEGLPNKTKLSYAHDITPSDQFVMNPGFSNFDPIEVGQPLAQQTQGEVVAPMNGYILMPLYQPQGSEGFFIVQDVD